MAGSVAPAGSAQDADRPFSKWAMAAGHLTKSFPGVRALDDVSVSIYAGEIAALLGQNGAGKSTLIQVMSGFHPAGSYSGRIALGGNDYRPADTAAAEHAGVVLVPQEVSVVPQMSVAENICLNAEPTRWGFIDVSLRLAKARAALLDFELDVDPHREMGSLDLATQQLIVIARALSKNSQAADLGRADGCSHGKGVFASLRPDSDAQGPRRRQHIRFPSSVGGLFHFRPHHRHAGRPHPRRSRHQ